ncbi:radical SAM protein [Lactococcus lactis]|jgi:cytosylglucuronate decarboxylase|uniref:Molybdenum cofactor biosynthesis protein MoaA n=2 Tax=Lactococcus lactis TaxID=1358 RepID=A0A0B8QTI6_LACLL|nr:radical SAM protein [Lactococcus lactis]MDN6242378.1 radical SAM protein [Tetragenococcus koreensis]ARE20922.1 radical SAM protein [Lactococcus lactis subsp. lactis]KST89221.1 Molybdenum cofactor biosynthesis protein MoaA [Lactococcus lactis subsp. lactis]KSU26547.1 Molybdenum cofactor biosynthesis protein MoaA [Lactococcus lactis subsp. lactis]MBU3886380.1 radical SAM protein [Lactococcus lactis]
MKYLFIRLHEACNAGCWFCNFAKSNDRFRLSPEKYQEILEECLRQKVNYIRFTGGEPLLDLNLPTYIRQATDLGIKCSIITNGSLLSRNVAKLKAAGLSQIIVSIDDIGENHNNNRQIKDLYNKAIDGLKRCKELGILTRVNTVCGPHNYKRMPQLKEEFSKIGVDYWELSALKLEEKIEYDATYDEIHEVIEKVYFSDDGIIPFGKMWCGDTLQEQNMYFKESIPPRVRTECSMTSRVRYYDAKNNNIYVCSLLPHRGLPKEDYYHFSENEKFAYTNDAIDRIAQKYRIHGKEICNGCSSTAAFYGERDYSYSEKSDWEY